MTCPNCGGCGCHCTWDEMAHAIQIIREQEREHRRKTGRKTVIEEYAEQAEKQRQYR